MQFTDNGRQLTDYVFVFLMAKPAAPGLPPLPVCGVINFQVKTKKECKYFVTCSSQSDFTDAPSRPCARALTHFTHFWSMDNSSLKQPLVLLVTRTVQVHFCHTPRASTCRTGNEQDEAKLAAVCPCCWGGVEDTHLRTHSPGPHRQLNPDPTLQFLALPHGLSAVTSGAFLVTSPEWCEHGRREAWNGGSWGGG